MWGALIGDIIGSRFENENHRSPYFELFDSKCRFTDDTVCTAAVADILEKCWRDNYVPYICVQTPSKYIYYGLNLKRIWLAPAAQRYIAFFC